MMTEDGDSFVSVSSNTDYQLLGSQQKNQKFNRNRNSTLVNSESVDFGLVSSRHYEMDTIIVNASNRSWWDSQTILLWHCRIFFLLFPSWPTRNKKYHVFQFCCFLVIFGGMMINNAFLIGSKQQFIDDAKYIKDGHFFLVAVVFVLVSYLVTGHYLNWNTFTVNHINHVVPQFPQTTSGSYHLTRGHWCCVNIILLLGWLMLVVAIEAYRFCIYKIYRTPWYVVQAIFNDLSTLTVIITGAVFYVVTDVVLANIKATEQRILDNIHEGFWVWKVEIKKLLELSEYLVGRVRPWFVTLLIFVIVVVIIIAYNGVVNGFGQVTVPTNAPFDKVQYVGYSVLILFVFSFSFIRASAVTKGFRQIASKVNDIDVDTRELEVDKMLFLNYLNRSDPGFKIFGVNVTFGMALFSVAAGLGQVVSVLRNVSS